MAKILLAADRMDRAARTGIDRYYDELIRGMPVYGSQYEFALLLMAGETARQKSRLNHLPIYTMASSRRKAYVKAFFSKELSAVGREVDADLIHLMLPFPLTPKRPSVVTIHDLTPMITPRAYSLHSRIIFRWMIDRLVRTDIHFIVISNQIGKDLHRLFDVPEKSIHCVYLGIDDHFHVDKDEMTIQVVRRKYQLPENYFLYVGSMNRRNLPVLLKAYKKLVDRGESHVKLVLAGRMDWGGDELVKMIDKLNIEDTVHLPGYISEEDLAAVIGQARALVYPSKYEGFGLPPLEAMACGTPVIASNAGAIPETTGGCAMLMSSSDISGWADAMEKVIQKETICEVLIERGLQWVKKFTWENTINETLKIYGSLINER